MLALLQGKLPCPGRFPDPRLPEFIFTDVP